MADLTELLGGIDILQQQLGTGSLFLKSQLPSSIHLLANWGVIQNNNQVVLVLPQPDPNTPVQFGKEEMYPPVFRKNNSGMDYIKILPGFSSAVGGSNVLNYCYAIEIIMDIQRDNNGTFTGYKGIGAFTMSYNPMVADNGNYKTLLTYPYPDSFYTAGGGVDGGGRYYLQGLLSPPSDNSQLYDLNISLEDLNDSGHGGIPVLSYKVTLGSNAGIYTSDTLTSYGNTVDGIITDLQLILPSQEKDYASREDFINYFAFDYGLIDSIKLDPYSGRFPDDPENIINVILATPRPSSISLSSGFGYTLLRTYAIRHGTGTTTAESTTHISINQPVYIDVSINYDIDYTRRSYPIYNPPVASGASPTPANILVGYGTEFQPVLKFYGAGHHNAKGKITGTIFWTYTTQRDRSNLLMSELDGGLIVNNFIIDPGSISFRPSIDLDKLSSFPAWWRSALDPLFSQFNDTLKIENFGLVSSYVLFSPGESDYEILKARSRFHRGTISPVYPNYLEFLAVVGYQKRTAVDGVIIDNTTSLNTLAQEALNPTALNLININHNIRNSSCVNAPCVLFAKINWQNTEDPSDKTLDAWDFSKYTNMSNKTGITVNGT